MRIQMLLLPPLQFGARTTDSLRVHKRALSLWTGLLTLAAFSRRPAGLARRPDPALDHRRRDAGRAQFPER